MAILLRCKEGIMNNKIIKLSAIIMALFLSSCGSGGGTFTTVDGELRSVNDNNSSSEGGSGKAGVNTKNISNITHIGHGASNNANGELSNITLPTITIIGDNPLRISQGDVYSDQGATALDYKNESISIVSSGEVDTKKNGTYMVTYTAIDDVGNETVVNRMVIVQ